MPRRAVFHKYPLIGRFAGFARQRAYLWSFKGPQLRPAFYAGSILAMLPLLGVQLPLALACSLFLRANFTVMGGLQFLSNPFTAAPIYYVTHAVGREVMAISGLGESLSLTEDSPYADAISEDATHYGERPEPPSPVVRHWSRRLGSALSAMTLGGIVCGTLLGLVLDVLHRFLSRHWPRRAPSGSTDLSPPPK